MEKTLMKIASILVLILFLVSGVSSNEQALASDNIDTERRENVPVNKTWHITFNRDLNPDSVKSDIVFITGQDGIKVETKLEISPQNTLNVSPVNDYCFESEYLLNISENVTSQEGYTLKSPLKLSFKTQKNIEINNLLANPYPALSRQQAEYAKGKVISPVLPYDDFFSLFTKLPLGHIKATGKGINVGVVGSDPLAGFIYFVAHEARVFTYQELSVEQCKQQLIRVVVVSDFRQYPAEKLREFAVGCLENHIVVVLQGDEATTESEIKLMNELEQQGVILVGQIQRQGVTYAYTYENGQEGTQAFNNRLREIPINIFAPNSFKDYETNSHYALFGTAGALAMVLENRTLNPAELKIYLATYSRNVWQSRSIDGTEFYFSDISTDSLTSEQIPRPNSNIYFFKQLDLAYLLGVDPELPWNANIYNLTKAWEISRGNIDVALIDNGFHPKNPYIENNVVEAKAFGKQEWNGNFHGTSMARALLSVAPDARMHLLLADIFSPEVNMKSGNIIKALDYCIEKKIPVVSLSWASFFGQDGNLVEKINQARDAGITIVWFWYPGSEDEAGIIGSYFTYSSFNDKLAAFDRFIEGDMYYPQEIHAGLSYTAPQLAGLCALLKAKNPDLSPQQVESILKSSSLTLANGALLPDMYRALQSLMDQENPSNGRECYYLLYNAGQVDNRDLICINDYASRLAKDQAVVLKDVTACKSAADIYEWLKQDKEQNHRVVKGIQIIGSSAEVPAFDVDFKIQMLSGIDEGGSFKSDFFYSNFKSDVQAMQSGFSIYKAFAEQLPVSFVPEWKVARLPLSRGEIAPFINKYYDYTHKNSGQKIPLVNFSNPIFANSLHPDDMGYFIQARLDQEFKLLDSANYRIYGNQQGLFPVNISVVGDFTRENLEAENASGVRDFILNSHGQATNIDRAIFVPDAEVPVDTSFIRILKPLGNGITEERISLLNNDNINSILGKNYYTLTLWTCLNAWNLRNDNLAHEALANGQAVNLLAASSILSNNGINNRADLEDMKKNNSYYFFYNFFRQLKAGYSRSDSFMVAQAAYAREIMKHTDIIPEGNYQFNLHNVLAYHYLGLFEYPEDTNQGVITLPPEESHQFSEPEELKYTVKIMNPEISINVNSLQVQQISASQIELTLDLKINKQLDCLAFDEKGLRLSPTKDIIDQNRMIAFKIPVSILHDNPDTMMKISFYKNSEFNGAGQVYISFDVKQITIK